MQTVTIKINNAHAARLIDELEAMSVIKIIKKSPVKSRTTKLSEKLAGSVTAKEARQMRKELNEMRNGWERNI